MLTYSIVRPTATHQRVATCAEVECPHWRNGWTTAIDSHWQANGMTAADQIAYLRADSRRKVETTRRDGVVVFTFGPGQECFTQHVVPIEREPLFVRRRGVAGDYADTMRHTKPEHWVEDFATNQDRLAKLID